MFHERSPGFVYTKLCSACLFCSPVQRERTPDPETAPTPDMTRMDSGEESGYVQGMQPAFTPTYTGEERDDDMRTELTPVKKKKPFRFVTS